MAAVAVTAREGCVDLNAYIKDLYENEQCTDFKIISTDDVDVNTSFKVHRAVIGRSKYFSASFNQSFKESGAGEIKLPEPSAVIKVIVQYIYNYPDKEIQDAVDRMSFSLLVVLCGAADKYLLPQLRQWSYNKWFEKFNQVRPATPATTTARFSEPADVSSFISALDSLGPSALETDIDGFLFVVNEGLRDGRGVFELSLNTRQAAFKANPELLQTFIEGYLKRTKDVHFPARCVSCDTQWQWNKFGADKKLACPCCKAENTWIGYLLHSTVVNGW